MNSVTLNTGGARSGKSRYALSLASQYEKRGFIATAVACDDEMKARIKAHKKERGSSFITIEEPYKITDAVHSLGEKLECIVLDCVTVWLGNIMHTYGEGAEIYPEAERFIESLGKPPCDLIIVTNEVGTGIIPHNSLARQFRDTAGSVNQRIADLSDTVVLMVSGIPVFIKGKK